MTKFISDRNFSLLLSFVNVKLGIIPSYVLHHNTNKGRRCYLTNHNSVQCRTQDRAVSSHIPGRYPGENQGYLPESVVM